ncbi:MAG: tetratricopeptide repeat protein [Spirochaetales bacterium]|uniref:Tetratricopeptide repeat protein n=1 Tax=Candidatus Thalassospirochaeta sargassi TaxID=3119039 RepID=A0AAJ1MII0_9SPIO|nr:tetratricopeptide repeat protein [Spirochaetales bacterium]
MRLFKKKETPEQTDIVHEKWNTSFSMFQDHRFNPESSEAYSSTVGRGNLRLKLSRKNLFAWTDDPLYRYDDFLLNAEVGIDPSNGYSSAGFLFRRTDDLSYYYFLVSNKGHYRLDLVLNGTPRILIDWTKGPEFNSEKFNIMISAEGSRLSFYIDGKWVGNVSDDSLVAGGFSFAGQNYDESDQAAFYLTRVELESRPVQLESRRKRLLPETVPAETRLAFAESHMRSGNYAAALVEIRKLLPEVGNNAAALMTAADCCMNLEMYTEASRLLDKVTTEERGERFFLQKAGLLYLMNDFIALRDLLSQQDDLINRNAAASNLLGNAEYSLGNWSGAAKHYTIAWEIDDSQPLFAFNAARAYERSRQAEKAAEMYGNAARQYFRSGEYDELAGILPFLEAIDESNPETRSLKAKLLFQDNDFNAAGKIFNALIKEGSVDSTVYYLNALIEARNSRPRKASEYFRKAIELEPDYYLYHFKFAEYLFLTDGPYEEPLERARELAPNDPWVLNLSGQVLVEKADYDSAAACFKDAIEAAGDEDEIRVNYSEALFLAGRTEDSLNLLTGDSPDVLNQRGNIQSRLNNFDAAVDEYEAAYRADRSRADIILNLAAACIEIDSFSRSEELLVRILDAGENAQAYNLMGNLALLKGEYSRAEAAYKKAVDLDPEFVDAVCNLAELHISREQLAEADIVLSALKVKNPGERTLSLKESIFRKRMNIYRCSLCGEEWIVPKKLPEQPALQLVGEPPDNMPAGKCGGCGKLYCIGCAKEHLHEGRLVCAECGERLKLSEDWMRYLYHESDLT